MKNIANEIMSYASKNYAKDGWDYVVECWTVSEIEEELAQHKIKTFESAKNHFAKMYGIVNERRMDARGWRD